MSFYSKMTFENDTRKIERAKRKYEQKKVAALTLLAEIDMLEKMEDVEDAEMWKRQSMKEKLVEVERHRKNLHALVQDYTEKYSGQEVSQYEDLLEDLEKDKAT
jgi:hypothetical protein